MRALIDGDIIKYSVGFACQKSVFKDEDGTALLVKQIPGGMRAINLDNGTETDFELRSKKAVLQAIGGEWAEEIVPEPDQYVNFTVKRMINSILKKTGADDYTVYLSDGDCFRVGVYPEYKANRRDTVKPYHVNTIADYLTKHHGAITYTEIEADDAMAIHQCDSHRDNTEPTIICTLDKDLDMVPGLHYKWNSEKIEVFDEDEAMYCFWHQTLTGDATDNIPGLPGIGKQKAHKVLEGLKVSEMKDIVRGVYREHGLDDDTLARNSTLLWMLRKPLEETYGKTYQEFMNTPQGELL
jgi:hypothetical protein